MNREQLDEMAAGVKAAVAQATGAADPNFVLLVPERASNDPEGGPRSHVITLSTLDSGRMVSLLCGVAELRISQQLENRQMGNALSALPDDTKEKMFRVLHTLLEGSVEYGGIPRAAWVDLMLIWSASGAHDAGLSEHDFLGAAIQTAQEEWCTPNTAGRLAVTDLLEKTKPAGA